MARILPYLALNFKLKPETRAFRVEKQKKKSDLVLIFEQRKALLNLLKKIIYFGFQFVIAFPLFLNARLSASIVIPPFLCIQDEIKAFLNRFKNLTLNVVYTKLGNYAKLGLLDRLNIFECTAKASGDSPLLY
jgi:UDP-N-acetylglucosamine:LPS N-acetylglucosamine transferase